MNRKTVLVLVAAAGACSDAGTLPQQVSNATLVVTFDPGNNLGSAATPLPINFNPSVAYTVRVEMHRPDGSLDTGFHSYVRISSEPGTVFSVDGGQYGRNVLLQGGVADNVQVSILGAFGPTRIWATDVGYVPVDLNRATPPQCADNIDNNGNYVIDYPTDPGCYAPNDDTEDKGTGATGASDVITYAQPRIADVRGGFVNGGTATPFENDQVNIATGFSAGNFAWDVVVTGLASAGFFATDLQDEIDQNGAVIDPQAGVGYNGLYAYTFSAPTKIGVCDRLRFLSGTTSDFYGFTELNYPTWAVEYWDPKARPCLVPEPTVLGVTDSVNPSVMFKLEATLVRLQTGNGVTLHVGKNFGPGRPDQAHGYTPYCDTTGCYTNCDLANNGKVNYANAADNTCATACTADPECTEFSNYLSNGGFTIVATDGVNTTKAQGDAVAATSFNPLTYAGQPINAFTGLVTYFSGSKQFTMQARCDDDVRVNPTDTPLDSAHACVNQNGNNPENMQ